MHIDMDAFFASVEQLTRPTLDGRPVLVGGAGGRGVVAGASYAARTYGARSAMPMHQARRLVGPAAVVLPPRGSVYREVSGRVFGIIRRFVPVIETLSFDEAFGEPAELAGESAGRAREFAERLRTAIRTEVGLPASVGFGSGKQIAKIASGQAKPDGVAVIAPSGELEFLQALPVRRLWGIGPVSEDRLARLGVETIGDFAAMAPTEVVSVLGATLGPALHRLAQGIDDRPVAERAEAKQISAESTFAVDIIDLPSLRRAVAGAAADAHRRLLEDGRGARTVVVKLRRADMSILTRSITMPAASTDLDVLAAAAQRVVLDPLDVGPIRLVGVGYSGLTETEQYSLFPDLGDAAASGAESALREPTTPEEPVPENPASTPRVEEGPPTDPRREPPGEPWSTGTDVHHPDFGHGWVQGAGHGFVTVRFETRATGPGRAITFRWPLDALRRADPLASLAWNDAE
ncbi:DNA polymerase IV [Gordonia sp. (in: high G+C Gram-positive bacteria)]|uniref:DNA polymerase IV n=1 Tax=Gordonia sp. (in: high G+C Gram-positive bacteria) TaxID=84139 RepID=UPI0039E7121E